MGFRKWSGLFVACLMLLSALTGGMRNAVADELGGSTAIPADGGVQPEYVTGEDLFQVAAHGAPVIRVYQDNIPWFGENRAHNTLIAMGKILGDDYFIHPTSALAGGIPAGTAVVMVSPNSFGVAATRNNVNDPAAQASLNAYLAGGGVLLMSLGDNDFGGGYTTPGATGTANDIFPSPCQDATLTAAAAGHPFVIGPDGIAATADDLDNNNIDLGASCFVAHGNLEDTMTLPGDADILMTATFNKEQKGIMAEYCVGAGRVVVDTLTKEFSGQNPPGTGPTFILRNLLHYALGGDAACVQHVPVDVKPTSCRNPLNVDQRGVLPVAILGHAGLDVTMVDPASVTLEGVAALRWNTEDVATPYTPFIGKTDPFDCTTEGADGWMDLTLKFDAQAIAAALAGVNDGDVVVLKLTGMLYNGTPIEGEDVVVILKK